MKPLLILVLASLAAHAAEFPASPERDAAAALTEFRKTRWTLDHARALFDAGSAPSSEFIVKRGEERGAWKRIAQVYAVIPDRGTFDPAGISPAGDRGSFWISEEDLGLGAAPYARISSEVRACTPGAAAWSISLRDDGNKKLECRKLASADGLICALVWESDVFEYSAYAYDPALERR
jgi:hypothetical protein